MKNCSRCEENGKILKNDFDTVGKVFYKIDDENILCYRHWYQTGRPKYKAKGDYHVIMESKKTKYRR